MFRTLLLAAAASATLLVQGRAAADTIPVSFEAPSDDGTPRDVPATLTLPDQQGRHPAVVLLHDSLGPDGRGGRIAEALAAAGIATLQPDLWVARGLTPEAPDPAPTDARALMPDAMAALAALAQDPRIDPGRIGIAGFGIGGRVAMLARSEAWAAPQMGEATPRYAAHMALYPGCRWLLEERGGLALESLHAAPAEVLAAGRDAADAPAACAAAIPAARTVVIDATHGWDIAGGGRMMDGTGRPRRMADDPLATEAATVRLTRFFAAALGPTVNAAAPR